MRKVFSIIVFSLLFATFMVAQSGFRTTHADGIPAGVSTSQISLNNAWFGSSFSYRLTGDADFNQNFLFNANLLYNIQFQEGGWSFPIVGNVALPLTGQSFDDIEIGVYPWGIISQQVNGTTFVLHGGLEYSVHPLSESELSPQAFKVLAGVEGSFPLNAENLPLTVSVTPVFETRNLDMGNSFGLEGTVIFPIAANLGLIAELEVPFDSDFSTSFSAGVLVNGAIGN